MEVFIIFLHLLLCTVASIVSYVFFKSLFYALNSSVLRLFISIQKRFSKIKNKSFFKWIVYAIFVGISTTIKSSFNLSYFWIEIFLGFFYSLSCMLVGESMIAG